MAIVIVVVIALVVVLAAVAVNSRAKRQTENRRLEAADHRQMADAVERGPKEDR
jgi:uncharacterized protein YpmB